MTRVVEDLAINRSMTLEGVCAQQVTIQGQGTEPWSTTVKVDGQLVSGCLTLAARVEGREIETIEGVKGPDGGLHPMQDSFIKHWAIQCGYCTPGMIMASIQLLQENPKPSEDEIKHYLAGNLCRCTGYAKIIEAVQAVADGKA